MKQIIQIKRAYEPADASDGYRVYIDRLWPRGLSHQTFHYDLWDKDIAPSTQLREWFHQNPSAEWTEFEKRYHDELASNPAFSALKEQLADKPMVTLLYSWHDTERNNAVVLQHMLQSSE